MGVERTCWPRAQAVSEHLASVSSASDLFKSCISLGSRRLHKE